MLLVSVSRANTCVPQPHNNFYFKPQQLQSFLRHADKPGESAAHTVKLYQVLKRLCYWFLWADWLVEQVSHQSGSSWFWSWRNRRQSRATTGRQEAHIWLEYTCKLFVTHRWWEALTDDHSTCWRMFLFVCLFFFTRIEISTFNLTFYLKLRRGATCRF